MKTLLLCRGNLSSMTKLEGTKQRRANDASGEGELTFLLWEIARVNLWVQTQISLSNSQRLLVMHTHTLTLMWPPDSEPETDSLILKQSFVCNDQDQGNRKKERTGGSNREKKKGDHRVKFNHLRFKFSSSTPRLHAGFIHGACARTPLRVREALSWIFFSSPLSCSVWLLLRGVRMALRSSPLFFPSPSFLFSPLSSVLTDPPTDSDPCAARWLIATAAVFGTMRNGVSVCFGF